MSFVIAEEEVWSDIAWTPHQSQQHHVKDEKRQQKQTKKSKNLKVISHPQHLS